MMETRVKQEECGGCVFCQSWCPRCNSDNVKVHFKAGVIYTVNEPENQCKCEYYRWLELWCQDCGAEFIDNPDLKELDYAMSNMMSQHHEIGCSAGRHVASVWTTGKFMSTMEQAMKLPPKREMRRLWTRGRKREEV